MCDIVMIVWYGFVLTGLYMTLNQGDGQSSYFLDFV